MATYDVIETVDGKDASTIEQDVTLFHAQDIVNERVAERMTHVVSHLPYSVSPKQYGELERVERADFTIKRHEAPTGYQSLGYNEHGIELFVKPVVRGDKYGRDACLTHKEDEAYVEFHANSDNGLVFVSRYYLSTLLGNVSENGETVSGVALEGSVRAWDATGNQVRKALLATMRAHAKRTSPFFM